MPRKDIPVASKAKGPSFVAPTPQNTPMVDAPITQISRPTVPDTISEGEAGDDQDDESDDARGLEDMSIVEEDLPYVVRRRVEGLKGLHLEYQKLEAQYKKELSELDRKYLALYTPVFERRHQVITGAIEPTEDEVARGEAETLRDDPEAVALSSVPQDNVHADVKGIPDFWLVTLGNCIDLAEHIERHDEPALRSLTDVRLEYLTPPVSGYKLIFHFAPNEFFTNETLTKTYHYEEQLSVLGDYVYSGLEGTAIDWKEDKDLTKKIELRKQKNKTTNRFRTVKRSTPVPSFFDFFSPPKDLVAEQANADDYDDAEIEDIRDRLETDYQIGEQIKEIIPRAVDYYTGRAIEQSIDGEELEEGDEDAWDDEESPSEEEIPMRSRRPVTTDSGKTDAGECNNQ